MVSRGLLVSLVLALSSGRAQGGQFHSLNSDASLFVTLAQETCCQYPQASHLTIKGVLWLLIFLQMLQILASSEASKRGENGSTGISVVFSMSTIIGVSVFPLAASLSE